jgi:mono/diheme cytochrome c family protein
MRNCLPCDRLDGRGEGAVGPDLLRPMPAIACLTETGLRALIRNPAAVRSWPAKQMPAFGATITDSDIDAVISYLRYLTARLATRP